MTPARPVSQILPHNYDIFFETTPTAVEKRFHPPPPPPTRVRTSHYRRFSTLYIESPYIDLEQKPARLIKRSSSIGGLQALSAMGINFTGKDKDKGKAKKEAPHLSPKVSEFGVFKSATPGKSKIVKSPELQSPSTSTGITARTSPAPFFRMKKKRSMASLFTSSASTNNPESSSSSTSASPGGSGIPAAPTSTAHVTAPSPVSDSSVLTFKTSGNNKVVSFKEPADDVSPFFVPKAIWAKRHNMTLHPYHGDVPYMQAYDPILLESDRYTELLLQHLSQGAPSFYDFVRKPPATALDLGCAQGHWVLHAANVWKGSQITGLDLVNIIDPAFEVTENAHFIQGNFLDFKLPFDDNSFEFVRMANLVLCIPYDKWETVFAEVRRVLTPGGRLEVIDDQMFFPYGEAPQNKPRKINTSVSSFEYDSDDDDLFEDSILQDDDSAETESTHISEAGSRPPSCDSKDPEEEDAEESQLSESATVRPLSAMAGSMSAYLPLTPDFAIPREPAVFRGNKPPPPPPNVLLKASRQLAWRRQAFACRDVETTFEFMLASQYGVFSRPADFVVDMLQNVFGRDAAGKVSSFHIKLAPVDSPIGPKAVEARLKASGGGSSVEGFGEDGLLGLDGRKKPSNKKKEGKEKEKDRKKDASKREDASGDGSGSSSSSKRSSLEVPLVASPVPASLNAKAAARLGLPHAMSAKAAGRLGYDLSPETPSEKDILKEKEKDKLAEKEKEKERTPTPPTPALKVPSTPSPPPLSTPTTPGNGTQPPIISAKAAGRLGISYSALTQASAESGRNNNNSKTNDGHPQQSPGLLVWPSTYIAMPPAELEMHACKYVHTLLGCRPAIAEFVGKHVDEQGRRLVDDVEFGEALWEYECFRRARFNWPSEIADPYEDDPSTTGSPAAAETFSVRNSQPGSILPMENQDTFNGQYLRDELTHLRTIRVFGAVKPESDDVSFLTMLRSKAFSPKP